MPVFFLESQLGVADARSASRLGLGGFLPGLLPPRPAARPCFGMSPARGGARPPQTASCTAPLTLHGAGSRLGEINVCSPPRRPSPAKPGARQLPAFLETFLASCRHPPARQAMPFCCFYRKKGDGPLTEPSSEPWGEPQPRKSRSHFFGSSTGRRLQEQQQFVRARVPTAHLPRVFRSQTL